MMSTLKTLVCLFAVLSVMACDKEKSSEPIVNNEVLQSKSAQAIVAGNNEFAFDFFKEVYKTESKEENFMVSPVSLSVALGMLYNGTNGVTQDEFINTLHYTESLQETNAFYSNLIAKLSSSKDGSVMEIANSIWIKDGFPVKTDFVSLNKAYFSAEVQNLDFSDPATLETINGWVSDKTHDKIPKVLNEISQDAVMYLVNALYFNAEWKKEFDSSETRKLSFYGDNGTVEQVDMMALKDDVSHFENDLFSAISLPYKQDKFSMILMLPNTDSDLNSLVGYFDNTTWNSTMEAFQTREVSLTMPKFKFEYSKKLNENLMELGLSSMFSTATADFSKLSDLAVFVSFVLQKTYIDVNEKGTEAAAVTVIGIETTSIDPNKRYFNANRPFLFAIKENTTGSICFMGKVGMPEYED